MRRRRETSWYKSAVHFSQMHKDILWDEGKCPRLLRGQRRLSLRSARHACRSDWQGAKEIRWWECMWTTTGSDYSKHHVGRKRRNWGWAWFSGKRHQTNSGSWSLRKTKKEQICYFLGTNNCGEKNKHRPAMETTVRPNQFHPDKRRQRWSAEYW